MTVAVSEVVSLLLIPLVLLVAGAVISGFLIPSLTRKRDDYRKALEVKTDLVSEMSEVVTEFIMAIQYAVLGVQDQRAYDEAFRRWEVRSEVIGTKLEVYFPGTTIGDQWNGFSGRVASFYATTGMDDADRRREVVDELLSHYGLSGGDEVTRALSGARPSVDDQRAWGRLKDAVQGEKNSVIRAVLGTESGALTQRRSAMNAA